MNDNNRFHEISNVEKQKNDLLPEELPEGPYGAPRGEMTSVENKSSPWKEGQRYTSAFNYEYKSLHESLPRQMDGAHPPHDDPDNHEQAPHSTTPD
ncbi:hypothetical protein [Bacillus cihuensis]|uniref:hypothetical protein n=1 Tax=Bacillus cihuensis TaxID=1208599 RepID=UPI0004054A1E|nr:hypothetical protein [Bacillus cihuensis]